MSKVHVLEQNGPGEYSMVLHYATPAGNNSAGISWVDCLVAGSPTTVLPEGVGPGDITTAEKAAVEAGTVIEISRTVLAESGTPLLDTVNTLVDALILEDKKDSAFKYKYFGYEIAS